MTYRVPLQEIRFAMKSLAGLGEVLSSPDFNEADEELIDAVLDENARFVEEVLAPLNAIGDRTPAKWNDGGVRTSPGFRAAYAKFVEGSWQSLPHAPDDGGQGLPRLLSAAVNESLHASNMSFALCPMLTDGVIDALSRVAGAEQRALYLPHLLEGRWTGAMNLTESQAGSDLSQIATRAVPQDDGSYRLFGQKIFITYGEHDFAENIVHLVLARVQGAAAGISGLSLFVVPKYLVAQDGTLGPRNDVWCASLEHKLGIHGSPTAMLLFGDGKGEVGQGAVGHLIGEAGQGLANMFIVMNSARFSVGLQGVAVSDRAFQLALGYAKERLQGKGRSGGPQPIAHHPDVQRMLMTMKSLTEGMRALAYATAAHQDLSVHHPDADMRARHAAFFEFLIPVLKGYCTETSLEVTSLGIQVHGGMGFIEETGAAQYYRDARILPIYEGTTAIQANDLVGRKVLRHAAFVVHELLRQMNAAGEALDAAAAEHPAYRDGLRIMATELRAGAQAWKEATDFLRQTAGKDDDVVLLGSVPYLMLTGELLCGWHMARAALVCSEALAEGKDDHFYAGKFASCVFYASHILPRAMQRARAVRYGLVVNRHMAPLFQS
ncbi:acyl-CoA dehydrogenase [Pollutimonas sp. H1-120]|uniref:acyl-CoA dehydrogenase n=1 Tax=Pollutimonas sp. H1-120 TaxID=3148824 RepID=UPI003B52E576